MITATLAVGIQDNVSISKSKYIVCPKYINEQIRFDIFCLLQISKPPEEFNYEADIKYLYYKENKLVGIIAYNIGNSDGQKIPVFIHVIGHPDFSHTREGYNFLYDTFRDLKKSYNIVVTHIPDDRTRMIRFALKAGFKEYSREEGSKYYYLDLEKIK